MTFWNWLTEFCLLVPALFTAVQLGRARYANAKATRLFLTLPQDQRDLLNTAVEDPDADAREEAWAALNQIALDVRDLRNKALSWVTFSGLLPTPMLFMLLTGLLLKALDLVGPIFNHLAGG